MHGTFTIPELKPGNRYRVQIGGADHVGMGGGYGIWINGKLLLEHTDPSGRGSGGKPKGAYITKEFMEELGGGDVTIAAKSFIRYNDNYQTKPREEIPQGRFSVHLAGQKLPPMGDDLLFRSAAVVPMMSSEWQAKYDAEDPEMSPDDHKFRWDGKFVVNPSIMGEWKAIGLVADI